MTAPNPYQPPTQDQPAPQQHPDLPDGWVPCPNCSSTFVQQPSFTWWGGMVGQKLLNHVKCQSCGTAYNAKTGGSNTPAIVAYQVVAVVILLVLFFALGIFD